MQHIRSDAFQSDRRSSLVGHVDRKSENCAWGVPEDRWGPLLNDYPALGPPG